MKKCKSWVFVITVVLVMGMYACTAFAIEVGKTSDGFSWRYENSTMEITSYSGTATDITFPSVINGVNVTVIGGYIFHGNTKINKISIPNTVKKIGKCAFYDSSLSSITLSNSLTTIEEGAFERCSSLKSITLPNSLTTMGDSAFSACSSLSSITLPNSLTTIGRYAFEECSSLTSITLPNSLKTIGDFAFKECSSLSNIVLPNSLTTIGISAFESCSSLKSITLPNSLTEIGCDAFFGCSRLKKLTSPKVGALGFNLSGFGYYYDASSKKKKVVGFTIYGYKETSPGWIASAYSYAKDNDFSFVDLQNNEPEGSDEQTDSNKKEKQFKINKGGMSVTYEDSDGNTKTKSVNIKKIVGKVKNLIIPSSVTHNGERYAVDGIANGACKNNKTICTVSISNSIKSIGDEVFLGCSNLKKVTIPSSVNKIGKGAFQNDKKLKTIIIKTKKLSTKNIGKNAFKGINKKAVFKVPKKKKKAYKKLLKKKGISKKAKVK